MSVSAAIPEVLRLEAIAAGLDEASIARRWSKYLSWHWKKHGREDHDFRRGDWLRHVQWEVDDQLSVASRISDKKRAELAALQAESQRSERERAAKDAEYAKSACTFPEWCALLRRQYAEGVDLASHEEQVVAYAGQTEHPTLMGYMAWASEPKSSPGLEDGDGV